MYLQARSEPQRAAILVERVTRFIWILALPLGKTSDAVADAVIETTTALPALLRRSVTWTQGSEMAQDAHITAATKMPVCFAHPLAQKRGSNENLNRVIRCYLPKSTDITDHQPYLEADGDEINELPMKLLGWRTPVSPTNNSSPATPLLPRVDISLPRPRPA